MKKIYLIAACTIALLSACKSPKTIQQETGAVEIKLPFSEKEFQTNKEFFRATNMGKSPDIATSKKVALLNAKSELASNINSTIKKVTESYTNQRSVADKQDFDQVRGKVHNLIVRLPYVRQRANTARYIARVGIDQVRALQLTLGVVNLEAVRVQNFFGQGIFLTWFEPFLVGVMDKLCVGQVFTPICACIEVVVV